MMKGEPRMGAVCADGSQPVRTFQKILVRLQEDKIARTPHAHDCI